ncbi:cerebellar degeneration-related protein 2-like isoform X1 [Exaiptasia diaphana]|uniref:Cerebellar degeneration-related protein 2-like n=1 Tax=Exaiptasia diaphana TaxID=2652724 RepID=A0A913XYV6_EXADI|nr:cerebellar degeneration-related protein 2-like isoform X1 [Exaiptasia diaphana]
MSDFSLNLEFVSRMSEQKERTHLSDDLELAAEIGKNLLERNKELECLLKSSHHYLEEQALKNEFLEKQLETLREVNDQRNKAFEQMETTALELHKANQKLQNETNTMKKRYRDLTEMVDNMDLRCEEYRKEVEELQKERSRLQRDLSMALSFHEQVNPLDSEPEPADEQIERRRQYDEERAEKERQLEALNIKISNLREQHVQERSKREELEYELSELIQENQQLETQLRVFAERAEEWQQVASGTERAIDILSENPLNDSADDVVEDDSFVVVSEQLSRQSSALSDHSGVVVLSPSEEKTGENSASFFSELGDQYHELVRKYDALLDKCKQEGLGKHSLPIPKVQRAVQVSPLPSPNKTERRHRYFSESEIDYKPEGPKIREYKKMFQKIYTRLEESKNFRPGTP